MKRKTLLSTALVICLSMSMMAATACKSQDSETLKSKEETTESIAEASEEKETTTTAEETTAKVTTSEDTEAESSKEVKIEPSSETESSAGEAETSAETEADGLYAKAEKYINAAFAFYEKDAGQKLNLVVFESQIEETADGFAFDVRSRDGSQANVLVAKVFVNTTTGEMSDEWGRTWNYSDFS